MTTPSDFNPLDVLASLFDPDVASAGDIVTVANILGVDASDLFDRVIDRNGCDRSDPALDLPPALITKERAAHYLSMSTRRLEALCDRGELMPVFDGPAVRFTKAELDRYVSNLPARV